MLTATRSGWTALGVAFLAAASACYSPTVGNGQLACSTGGTCPDGYQCASNGYCYQSGAAVPPDAPTQVVASPGVRSAQVTWTAPAHDGGSAIASYTVTARPGGATASSTTTSATLNGLDNGTSYTFTVIATNAIGASRASAPSTAITTYGLPGAPTNVVAAGIPHGATVDWTPPADSGGTAVTGYLVQVSLNGGAYASVSPSISGTHATVGGLANGGTYTFIVAAVNAVGAGVFSAPSAPLLLDNVPDLPVITAPALVTAGDTGVAASVAAVDGETYAWTISGGTFTNPDGVAGEIAGGLDAVAITVTAAAGGQVSLTCIASNAIGSSRAATFTLDVVGAPVQPAITAAPFVTAGDTGLSALVAAHDGMTYSWTLSSNAVLRGSDLHGVTANGVNSISYDLAGSAAAGDQVQLSVVEVNGAQLASAPGTATQGVAAVPVTPTLTAPSALAAGATAVTASVPARAGMSYTWALAGAAFSSGSGAAGSTSGGVNAIQFDVTAAAGASVSILVAESNQAQRSSSAATATIPVAALPGALPIAVAFDGGASFQSGATQYATSGAASLQAQVAAVAGASYAWTLTGSGAVAHSGETGAGSTFLLDVTGASGTTFQLQCVLSLGPSQVTGNQTVTIVAPPATPAIALDGAGASGFVTAGDTASHTAAIAAPVATSSYAWSASPAAELASLGSSGASVTFALAAAAAAGETIALQAIETNAAGRAGSAGSATVTVVPPTAQPTVLAAAAVTVGDTGLTASVAARAGMAYTWTLSSNATLRSPDLHGVTAAGFNTLTYDLNGSASAGGQVLLSAVEVNAALQTSGAGTAAQAIAAAPIAPTLSAPSTVAAGEMGATASVPARAGMTYQWVLAGAAFSAGATAAGSTSGGTNTVTFDVTAVGGGQVSLSVIEINAALKQSSPSTATIPVGTLPNPLNIGVSLDNGTQFQSGATQYVTAGAAALTAQVSTLSGATYAWTIVSGGAAPHTGEAGTSPGFKFDVSGAAGSTILLRCVLSIGTSGVTGNQTVTVVAAPTTPTVALDGAGASEFLTAGDSATHHAAIASPVATSSYAWSASPAGSLTSLGSSGTSAPFVLAAAAAAGSAVTISAVETNAAGRAGSAGSGTVNVVAATAKPIIQAATSAVAPGLGYSAAIASPQSGVSYTWSLAEVAGGGVVGSAVACPSAGVNACIVNGDGSLSFTVDSGLATDGNHALELQLVAKNQAGQTSAATPVDLPAIALPNAAISFGPSPNGDGFGANITAGGTRTAFVAAGATSYLWSVSPGAIASGGATSSATFNAGAAAAGSTLALSCKATNAAGSSTGAKTVNVVAAASAPTISVAANATEPVGAFANTVYTATLTPGATAGISYRWTVSGGGTCSGSICGVTPIGSTSNGTFTYTVNAPLGTTLTFQAVGIDAAGDAGAASTSVTEAVIGAPQPPSISSTFLSPGAPAAASFTAFAPHATYDLSVASPRAGMTYVWTIGALSCPASNFCTDESSGHTHSSIELVADASITGGAVPQPGDQLSISLAEVNAAGSRASSAQPLVVHVVAAPAVPAIGVIDHFDNLLDGSTFPYVISEGQQAGPYVDAVSGQQYFWSTINSAGGASVLANGSTASGAAGTGPTGEATNTVTIAAPAGSAPGPLQLNVTTWNAATFTPATERDLSIDKAPVGPTIRVDELTSDVRTPQSLTYGAASVPASVTVRRNANDTPMKYACSADANAAIDAPPDPNGGGFTFLVEAAPTLLSGNSITTTLTCTETNNAGDLAVGTLVIPLAPPLTVALTPADGAAGVDPAAKLSALFSYEPDEATILADSTCDGSGNVTLVPAAGGCVAFTVQQDAVNKALFTFTPTAPLALGASYTLTLLASGGAGGIADQQSVPLGATTSATFTTLAVPDIASNTISITPHLQSFDLSWTNPVDAALDHVKVTATPVSPESGTTTVVTAKTLTAADHALTIAGLNPGEAYTLKLYVAEDAAETRLSPGITKSGQQLGLSGAAADFTANQTVAGLGPSFNGTSAASFALTWNVNELYLGFIQSDLAANALRNSGDALWLAIDVDGSASGADVNGESATATGGAVYVNDQIIWPFKADYVIELKLLGGVLQANLRTVASNSWASISTPVDVNGVLAGLKIPATLLGGNTSKPRFAFAFLNTLAGGAGNAVVFDVAPAAYAADTSDGHTPATDVLGALASITNSIDAKSRAFTPAAIATSLSGSARTPAPALVTFQLDASAASIPSTDAVKIEGSLPPLSYTLSDSNYQLADDGTRGSANSSGHYTGVFNFGLFNAPDPTAATSAARQELFFKFADGAAAESTFGGGSDRVWTLTGSSETVGNGIDPIVFNQVYAATHPFKLDFIVSGVPGGAGGVTVAGNVTALTDWNGGTALSGGSGAWSGLISFASGDFVSGGSNCGSSTDAPGCPLNWKAVVDGTYEDQNGGNDTMNDDVLNRRTLGWPLNVQTDF